jgi:hypothetical protein
MGWTLPPTDGGKYRYSVPGNQAMILFVNGVVDKNYFDQVAWQIQLLDQLTDSGPARQLYSHHLADSQVGKTVTECRKELDVNGNHCRKWACKR